jgi:hypothetical protein
MRRSPWVEHKLVLGEFLGAAEGRSLLRGAARAAGLREAEFRQVLATLPPMDFYVADHVARHTWQGTGDYLLMSSADGGGTYNAFTSDGSRLSPQVAGSLSGYSAVILLHPAEPKAYRLNYAETSGPGKVISDSPLRDAGLIIEYTSREGRVVNMDVGRNSMSIKDAVRTLATGGVMLDPEECQQSVGVGETLAADECLPGGGPPPPPPSSWGTYVPLFLNFNINDHDGQAEVELKVDLLIAGDAVDALHTKLKFFGVERGDVLINESGCGGTTYGACIDHVVTVWSNYAPTGANQEVRLNLMEIDGNGFDEVYHWEYVPFITTSDWVWQDGPFTMDRCTDLLGYVAVCAGGSVRFIDE